MLGPLSAVTFLCTVPIRVNNFYPKVSVLVGCDTTSVGDCCLMTWDSLVVSDSKIKMSNPIGHFGQSPSDVTPHPKRTQTWTTLQQKPNNLEVLSPRHIPSTLQTSSIINSICMLLKMETRPLLGCYPLISLHCIITQNNVTRLPHRCVFILNSSRKCCVHSCLCYLNQNWLTR